MPDSKILFLIATSVADAAAVTLNGNKMLLVDDVSTFFINGKPAGIKGIGKLRKLSSWVVFFQ